MRPVVNNFLPIRQSQRLEAPLIARSESQRARAKERERERAKRGSAMRKGRTICCSFPLSLSPTAAAARPMTQLNLAAYYSRHPNSLNLYATRNINNNNNNNNAAKNLRWREAATQRVCAGATLHTLARTRTGRVALRWRPKPLVAPTNPPARPFVSAASGSPEGSLNWPAQRAARMPKTRNDFPQARRASRATLNLNG